SSFVVTIPAEKRYYSADEIDNRESTQPLNSNPDIYQGISGNISDKTENEKYSLPKILLVEDNVELREYLAGHFSKIYKVYEAENGEKGYKCAKEKNPDIIVTDIMMPIMNGFEFCKKVRNNFEISHIPVIMLTANSAVEKQIEGLSTGADAYVTKPFDIELLDSVLNSVLLNRKMLREKFLGIEPLNNHENKLTKKDNIFIKDLKLYIEENIANHALNIDLLSRHFAVSRTQLNRKTKSLVGQTPNSLIRSIRLKKAYNLIRNDGVRVSEAAYSTGFTDPNYFTVCFKKEFGENPSRIN
ncbi:MAG: response regulator, partial [Draconibacterium sp.]|nr:response regulator [Draconibacterium sp.]